MREREGLMGGGGEERHSIIHERQTLFPGDPLTATQNIHVRAVNSAA